MPDLLMFTPRKKAPANFYVVNLTGGFSGMSRWHTRAEAEIAAEIMREEIPDGEIAVLAPVQWFARERA